LFSIPSEARDPYCHEAACRGLPKSEIYFFATNPANKNNIEKSFDSRRFAFIRGQALASVHRDDWDPSLRSGFHES